MEARYVSIPSNGSSLYQAIVRYRSSASWRKSQSPQTGQVYFNRNILCIAIRHGIQSHNPLKRVKFISIYALSYIIANENSPSHNPLKRVKFISILKILLLAKDINIVTIPSNGSSLFQSYRCPFRRGVCLPRSQSPQTGQVYLTKNKQSRLRAILCHNPLKQSLIPISEPTSPY